jgi:hypothetical protein
MSLGPLVLLVAFLASGIVGAALLSRDDRAGTGFLLGAALGPIGVGVILSRRRTWEARWHRQAAGAEERRKEQAFRDWRGH